MNHHLEVVWPDPHPKVRTEAIEFWTGEEILSPAMRDARVSELLVIARDAQGTMIANSSAARVRMQNLGFPCFYYRNYVAREHRTVGIRGSDIAQRMLETSIRVLNRRYQAGFDPEVLGMFLEIESNSVKRHYRDTVWNIAEFRFFYFGNTPEGNHCRLAYFEGSELP